MSAIVVNKPGSLSVAPLPRVDSSSVAAIATFKSSIAAKVLATFKPKSQPSAAAVVDSVGNKNPFHFPNAKPSSEAPPSDAVTASTVSQAQPLVIGSTRITGIDNATPAEVQVHTALALLCARERDSQARVASLYAAAHAASSFMIESIKTANEGKASPEFWTKVASEAARCTFSERGCNDKGFITISADQLIQQGSRFDATFETELTQMREGKTRRREAILREVPGNARSATGFINASRALRNGTMLAGAVTNATELALDIVARRIGASPAEVAKAAQMFYEAQHPSATPRLIITSQRVAKKGEDAVRAEYKAFRDDLIANHVRPQLRERLQTSSAVSIDPQQWREWVKLVGEQPALDSVPVKAASAALEDSLAARRHQDRKQELVHEFASAVDFLETGTAEEREAAAGLFNHLLQNASFRGPLSIEQIEALKPHVAPLRAEAVQALRDYASRTFDVVPVAPPPVAQPLKDWVDVMKSKAAEAGNKNVYVTLIDDKMHWLVASDSVASMQIRANRPSSAKINAALDTFYRFDKAIRDREAAARFAAASEKAVVMSDSQLRTMPVGLALTVLADAPNILAYCDAVVSRGVTPDDLAPLHKALASDWPVDPGTRPAWLVVFEKLSRLQPVVP